MPDAAPEPGIPYLGRYLAVLVIAVVALTVIGWVLMTTVGFAVPPGAAAILPPMAGALHVGQHWGRERNEVPQSSTAWRWAIAAGSMYLGLLLVLLAPVFVSGGLGSARFGLVFLLIGGAVLMSILLNRFFLTQGARSTAAGAAGR